MRGTSGRTRQHCIIAMLAGGALALACAKDRILPVKSRCGDGIVTGTEQCDVNSPGCVDCRIATGWTCPSNVCAGLCGDGKLEGTEECDPPDGITCDDSCKSAKTSGCDLSGYYAVHQVDFSRDTIVGQLQTSSNWYFFRFVQTGSAFQVAEVLYCGIYVTGTVTVSLDDNGLRALLYSNRQDAKGAHGPRGGTFVANGTQCDLSFDRWYLVRGVDEAQFLPTDFSTKPALATLPPLPTAADPLHPTGTVVGATDPDGDGISGLALHLSGNLSGVRNVAQRDWNEYAPDPALPVQAGSIEFSSGSTFDNEEHVLGVTGCTGAACSLLLAGSTPARDRPSHVVFRYLGKNIDDPRVAAIAAAPPDSDVDVDMETCANVRTALPHEPVME